MNRDDLKLREGAWYERRDGKIVGPARVSNQDEREWFLPGGVHPFYKSTGKQNIVGDAPEDLIREVPPPPRLSDALKAFKPDDVSEEDAVKVIKWLALAVRESGAPDAPSADWLDALIIHPEPPEPEYTVCISIPKGSEDYEIVYLYHEVTQSQLDAMLNTMETDDE